MQSTWQWRWCQSHAAASNKGCFVAYINRYARAILCRFSRFSGKETAVAVRLSLPPASEIIINYYYFTPPSIGWRESPVRAGWIMGCYPRWNPRPPSQGLNEARLVVIGA